ncbi:MAG: oligosaccharide flippase family protein [archaeon]
MENEITKIFKIIKNRKFKGYTGLAVKNSIYQFGTTISAKIGALLFTIILARILMPELFGLYSLALATIVLLATVADFGIQQSLIRFVSQNLSRKKEKRAKSYTKYFFKLRIILAFSVAMLLAIFSKIIANNYYNQPISLALIAGSFYILSITFIYFVESLFQSTNKFKYPFFKEIFFQGLRLILIPLVILSLLKYGFSDENILFFIFLSLAFTYFLTLIFIFLFMRKHISFLKSESEELTKKEKKDVIKFILPLSATVFSGAFFGYIDIIMLGKFVASEFIGYYRVAFSLISSAIHIINFSFVLFPLFSRLKGGRLERALKKTITVSLGISSLAVIGTIILAPLVISLVFGKEYSNATVILQILALLLISGPLTATYTSYLISKGKPKMVAKLLIYSTVINIILNYIFITWFLSYSQFLAVIGATIATIISRYFYLATLIYFKKKY